MLIAIVFLLQCPVKSYHVAAMFTVQASLFGLIRVALCVELESMLSVLLNFVWGRIIPPAIFIAQCSVFDTTPITTSITIL